jgi:hypothetical protein
MPHYTDGRRAVKGGETRVELALDRRNGGYAENAGAFIPLQNYPF